MRSIVHNLCIIIALAGIAFLPQAATAQCPDTPFNSTVGPLMPDGTSLSLPGSMAIGPNGEMYLGTEDGVIRVFMNGAYVRTLPTAYRGTTGIDVDGNGNIYLAGYNSLTTTSFVKKLDSSGSLISDFEMPAGSDPLNHPFGVRCSKTIDRVYVTDTFNGRVVMFTRGGASVGTFASYSCYGLAIGQNDEVFVVENDGANIGRVQRFSKDGELLGQFGSGGTGDTQLNHAVNLFAESTGNLVIADKDNHCWKRYSPTGGFICKMGTRGMGDGQFRECRAICVGPNGVVYAADNINARFQIFGTLPTPAKTLTFGGLKVMYR